jgi:hypothetical protein
MRACSSSGKDRVLRLHDEQVDQGISRSTLPANKRRQR